MSIIYRVLLNLIFSITAISLGACAAPQAPTDEPLRVGLVVDSGSVNDRGFNQYTMEGVRSAAEELGLEFDFSIPPTATDYEASVEQLAEDGHDLIVTVGFRMAGATTRAALRHPDIHFISIDVIFEPGAGCAEQVTNCYSEEGGLTNVTSLVFAEDQLGYLAGTLAACMSETGTIASVAGIEIPPVIRFVEGYENGARTFAPDITVLNEYIPDFNDPDSGKVVAQTFIEQDADVIFGVGGSTGNGGLLAAHEAEIMAIGVDVDQYYTYPEVAPSLITSAAKNMNVAAASAVRDFAAGDLQAGVRMATVANGGVGLAPYHDWEERVPQECDDGVTQAEQAILDDPSITGASVDGA